jgi:DnaJ-class molecular chaperone
MSTAQVDHYEALGVAKTATREEIHAAFRRLAYLHPDKHPTDPTATARFTRITAAYATLSDPERRALYDLSPTSDAAAAAAPGPVTDAVNFVVEVIKGAREIDPQRAALGLADRLSSTEGRRELRNVWSGLRDLLR